MIVHMIPTTERMMLVFLQKTCNSSLNTVTDEHLIQKNIEKKNHEHIWIKHIGSFISLFNTAYLL